MLFGNEFIWRFIPQALIHMQSSIVGADLRFVTLGTSPSPGPAVKRACFNVFKSNITSVLFPPGRFNGDKLAKEKMTDKKQSQVLQIGSWEWKNDLFT